MRTADLPHDCDILVVGGGINGAGIARDAAGRGLSVVLCEQDDLASHTSSASSKLIHGGLRYLEHHEFGLVRKALIEREVLLRAAPHVIRPLQFIMPHGHGQRPAWLIGLGLFLYDHLARREILPGSCRIDLSRHVAGEPIKGGIRHGFAYSDGWVDDSRLVILNAIDAAQHGARIMVRTRCDSVQRGSHRWLALLRRRDGSCFSMTARCLVNATGPWAAQFLESALPHPGLQSLRLVKGSHIVVRRLYSHSYAYLFQHEDGRVVFALPFERDFTLIGTTEIDFRGDPSLAHIEPAEIEYLCGLVNRYFKQQLAPADVLWSFSGVRPLLDDWGAASSALTRDYRLALDTEGAPLLSVFGGKITTFRKLAEQAVDCVAPLLGNQQGGWTARACLPGGDILGPVPGNRAVLEFDAFVQRLRHQYSWIDGELIERYARAYGTRVHVVLAGTSDMASMGEEIIPGLFAVEAEYLVRHEWARCAADILWRRSKLGLHADAEAAAVLDNWISRNLVRDDALGQDAVFTVLAESFPNAAL